MTTFLHDIGANAVGGVSISPGVTGDVNGGWVDLGDSIENVNAMYANGVATGTPTSYAVTVKIQEADDNSGTNAQDIPGASATIPDAAPAVNDKKTVFITTGLRSKRFCRVVSDQTITGGSTPTVPQFAALLALKARV